MMKTFSLELSLVSLKWASVKRSVATYAHVSLNIFICFSSLPVLSPTNQLLPLTKKNTKGTHPRL